MRNHRSSARMLPLGLLASIVIVLGGGWIWGEVRYRAALQQPSPGQGGALSRVSIPSGTNLSDAARILLQAGAVKSADSFVRYVRSQGWETRLRAGEYAIPPGMVIPDVALRVTGQRSATVRITIPEGFTVRRIAELLESKGLTTVDAFLACVRQCPLQSPLLSYLPTPRNVEGFLFPETYQVDPATYSDQAFLTELLDQSWEVLSPYRQDWEKGRRKLYDIVTMASMIEREALSDEERPVIAGILWKRLDAGWFLGVDATTRYEKDDWQNPITARDLSADTPYNTRKNKGLPPTPIANPGERSIRAALYPEASPYWYYLHDAQGAIHYARTQTEHDTNRARYL